MTKPDISAEAIRELLEGVTPGPWVIFTPDEYEGPTMLPGLGIESKNGDAVVWYADAPETGLKRDADAAFIAAARELVPALAAEVERLTRERDEARALAEEELTTAWMAGSADGAGKARERIAAQLDAEADLTPCEEDAKVVRGCALLVRADFSYERAEEIDSALAQRGNGDG